MLSLRKSMSKMNNIDMTERVLKLIADTKTNEQFIKNISSILNRDIG